MTGVPTPTRANRNGRPWAKLLNLMPSSSQLAAHNAGMIEASDLSFLPTISDIRAGTPPGSTSTGRQICESRDRILFSAREIR